MSDEKPGFWAILPAVVRYDKSLPPMARLLYAEISALCNRDGVCTARNAYFSGVFEISEVQVSRLIHLLEARGQLHSENNWSANSREITLSYDREGAPKNENPLTKKIRGKKTLYQKRQDPLTKKIKGLIKNVKGCILYNRIRSSNKNDLIREGADAPTRAPEQTAKSGLKDKKPQAPSRTAYGEFCDVFLSDEERQKLLAKIVDTMPHVSDPAAHLHGVIENMSRWQQNHQRYKNHYAAICTWLTRDAEKPRAAAPSFGKQPPATFKSLERRANLATIADMRARLATEVNAPKVYDFFSGGEAKS